MRPATYRTKMYRESTEWVVSGPTFIFKRKRPTNSITIVLCTRTNTLVAFKIPVRGPVTIRCDDFYNIGTVYR